MRQSRRKGLSILSLCLATALVAGPLSTAHAAAPTPPANQKATKQLFDAVYANDFDRVQASVENGADVEARDRWGMTPADVAIDRGNYRIAHLLVSVRNTRRARDLDSPEKATPAVKAVDGKPMSPPVGFRTASGTPNLSTTLHDSPSSGESASRATPVAATSGPNPFDPATPVYGSRLRSIDNAAVTR